MNDAGYEYCAAFFSSLVGHGVTHAVVSPGSRSTPLTLSADATTGLALVVHHDERSAGFFALGLAKARREPVALICTSGTAAANYLPSVVEAFYTGVPLIVLTADRPVELRELGAPQTIDQVGIYGSHTVWSAEMPIPDDAETRHARVTARRAAVEASVPPKGPVHLNWPLRKPLEPSNPLPAASPSAGQPIEVPPPEPSDIDAVVELTARERGLILAGPGDLDDEGAARIAEFAAATGWPILADATSQLRAGPASREAPVVSTAHHLLGSRFGHREHPEVMIRFGGIPTSPAIERWLTQLDAVDIVALDPEGRWRDPTGTITTRIQAAPEALLGEALARIHKRPSGDWTGKWVDADRQAAAIIAAGLQGPTVTEPGIAAALCAELPAGAALYVSNSMPVRDVDQFMATRQAALRVLSNRGASGIDGVTSSALGAAYELAPAVLLCGDLAFLHDASGLLVGGALGVDLTIVVPNNDGGGIFSLLPVVNTIPASDFERLFHTPHGVDLSAVAAAAGAAHLSVATLDEFSAALAASIAARGLSVIEARVDTEEGLRLRRTLEARVRESIDDPPG